MTAWLSMRSPIHLPAALLLIAACGARPVPAPPEPAGPIPASSGSSSFAAPPVASTRHTAIPSPPMSPTEAAALVAHADACLADPACTEGGEALYRRADDAGATGVSCFRFYYGIGVALDRARARACFERQVAADGTCGGSSPSLDRLYLAAMLIDGQGGAPAASRAESLLADCFRDVSVEGLLREVPTRSAPDSSRKALDFCKDIGGTTVSTSDCIRVESDGVTADRVRVERRLFSSLDAEGRALEIKARKAYADFTSKEGAVQADVFRGGSASSNRGAAAETQLQKQRTEALGHFFDPPPPAGADLQAAERDLDRAYRTACDTDAERRKLCAAARKSWSAYVDAEIALYWHPRGAPSVRTASRDVKTTLVRAYQKELEDVAHP